MRGKGCSQLPRNSELLCQKILVQYFTHCKVSSPRRSRLRALAYEIQENKILGFPIQASLNYRSIVGPAGQKTLVQLRHSPSFPQVPLPSLHPTSGFYVHLQPSAKASRPASPPGTARMRFRNTEPQAQGTTAAPEPAWSPQDPGSSQRPPRDRAARPLPSPRAPQGPASPSELRARKGPRRLSLRAPPAQGGGRSQT